MDVIVVLGIGGEPESEGRGGGPPRESTGAEDRATRVARRPRRRRGEGRTRGSTSRAGVSMTPEAATAASTSAAHSNATPTMVSASTRSSVSPRRASRSAFRVDTRSRRPRRSTPSRRLWGTHPASSGAREGKGLVSVAERAGARAEHKREKSRAYARARNFARAQIRTPNDNLGGCRLARCVSGRGARARATAHLEYERQSAGAFASLKRDGDADAVGVHLEATKDPVGRAGRLDARVHRRHVRPQHLRRRRGVRAHARARARIRARDAPPRGRDETRARVRESSRALRAVSSADAQDNTAVSKSIDRLHSLVHVQQKPESCRVPAHSSQLPR